MGGDKEIMNGHISILRVNSSHEGNFIEIQVTDRSSGVRFLEVRMSLSDFAMAITQAGHQPCEFEVRGLEVLGKVRETKREVVPYEYSPDGRGPQAEAMARAAIAQFEEDGWKGEVRDYFNSNNSVTLPDGSNGRRVTFIRYIDSEGGPEMTRFTNDGYKDLEILAAEEGFHSLGCNTHPIIALVCQKLLQRVEGLPTREQQEVELLNALLGIVDAAIEDGLIEEE